MGKVLVTTDASVNRGTGLSSWAYSAVKSGIRYSGGGILYRNTTNSNEAEVCAIANAIHSLYIGGVLVLNDELHIHTDSMRAMQLMIEIYAPKNMTPVELEARAHYLYMTKKLCLTVRKRWVRVKDSFTLQMVDYNAKLARRNVERSRQDDDSIRGVRQGVWNVCVGRTKSGQRRKARDKKVREDRSGARDPRIMERTSEWEKAARDYTDRREE